MHIHTSRYKYELSQLTETPTKQAMIAAEEAVLTEALALYHLVKHLEEFQNVLIHQCDIF